MSATLDRPIGGARMPLRWSVADYERVVALGGFPPEKRVELIEGEIVEVMPQNPPHRIAVSLILGILVPVCGANFHIVCQGPLRLETSVPEPDIAVVTGQPRDYLTTHPTTAALVIEVSDTTVEYDQTVKAALYAAAGIAEYWIVNLDERTVEVRRQPGPSGYRSLQTFSEQESVSPLFQPAATVTVANLLP